VLLVKLGQLIDVNEPGRPDPVEVSQAEPLGGYVIRYSDLDYAVGFAGLGGKPPPPLRGILGPLREPFALVRRRPQSEGVGGLDVGPLVRADGAVELDGRSLSC
jgi:hypothetical protein